MLGRRYAENKSLSHEGSACCLPHFAFLDGSTLLDRLLSSAGVRTLWPISYLCRLHFCCIGWTQEHLRRSRMNSIYNSYEEDLK
ncbi:hypothetical protein HGRIS_011980 [Hohenbuehelia grisea]|uniref:Uncharacterized protein n=1 Tax=Hohenbuehelia grisea TaxID=104357 RepID=A0ABR3JZ18_9AGAR